MIVTSMQLTISSRRDIAVLQKESSALEGEEDVNALLGSKPIALRRARLRIEPYVTKGSRAAYIFECQCV